MIVRWPSLAVALCLMVPGVVVAQTSPSEQRGLTLLHANCSQCHAVDKVSPSRLKIAPPFRDLHLRYSIEDLQRSLVEGIRTGHPNMPEFRFDVGQAADVIAYLKSLER